MKTVWETIKGSTFKRQLAIAGLCALFLATAAGWVAAEHAVRNTVPSGLTAYSPSVPLSGTLTIAGSDTMQPVVAKLAAAFKLLHPEVVIAVEGGGSSQAIREFIVGLSGQRRGDKNRRGGHLVGNQAKMLSSSRALTAEERRAFISRYGYEPLEIPIAMDAVAIYVSQDNPLQGLTMEQVDAIFGTTRKRGFSESITAWSQVGLGNDWKGQPIHLFGRDKRSGTRDFFKQIALLNGELKADIKEQPGAALEILSIARDPLAIGYAGIGFQSSFARAVPLAVEKGQPYVLPSDESVKAGTYPLARQLYLYTNQAPDEKFDSVMQEFLKFVNSRQGQETVARAHFFPLTSTQVATNMALINGGIVTAEASAVTK
ncbi:MAG: PstS family phosphate ABC transporter substrate-binding protein [Nitrospiraceae bacterium]